MWSRSSILVLFLVVPQEREKTRIVLASILKPLDDTRMTEKLGATLALNDYAVTVIGYAATGALPANISFQSLGTFRRLSFTRWWSRWRVFSLAFSTRPDVFIFSTYELIFPALLLKIISGTRVVYDVRENYYRNILHSEGLPFFLRRPLALLVRGVEKITAPMIDHHFLAERGYESEFRFHLGGWTVLENKALPISTQQRQAGRRLLFSGTLSESTGVFRAIRLARILQEADPGVTLTIAGYAATDAIRRRIRKAARGADFIRLVGIDNLVPHREIVAQIQQANAGIIAYLPRPHTQNSVPTKLYEYLTACLPVICDAQWPWVAPFSSTGMFVTLDFEKPDPASILERLAAPVTPCTPPAAAAWSTEAPRLLEAIKNIV